MNKPRPLGLGRAVAILRAVRGWTQEELAREAQLDTSYVSRVEGDHRDPSLATLNGIAAALGTSHATLMRIAEDTPEQFLARFNGCLLVRR